jgi:parallel beta-helix repeat protein
LAPDITNPDITNPDVTNATVFVGPGDDWVQITLRIADTNPGSGPTPTEFLTTSVTPAVVAQAVNTIDAIGGGTTPPITIPGFVVTNVADNGPGSLRQAILDANQNGPSVDTIRFNIPGAGAQTINLGSQLPAITGSVVLDGASQPGYAGTPLIQLNGAGAGAAATALSLTGSSNVVRGLSITGFGGRGIAVWSSGNTITDNVIAANGEEGISIRGSAGASGNIVTGNYVGLDTTGSVAAGNGLHGIAILDSPANRIGGATAAERNVISANVGEGVRIAGTLSTGNVVQGNYIGTTVSGDTARGNLRSGVYLRYAPGNSVMGNVISGNVGFSGVAICGTADFCGGPEVGDTSGNNAAGNIVRANVIGLNAARSTTLGNSGNGISIDGAPGARGRAHGRGR